MFNTLREAQVLIEQWRQHFNTIRPHSALGYRPPAPEAVMPVLPLLPLHRCIDASNGFRLGALQP